MKKCILLMAALISAHAFGVTYYWVGQTGSGDFANFSNWNTLQDGTGSAPTSFAGNDFYAFIADPNGPEISSTLSSSPDDIYVATNTGTEGQLIISGGTNTITNRLRAGRSGATAYITVTGGSFSAPNTYSTFGDTGNAVWDMTGGELNFDRLTLAQTAGDSCIATISGGFVNITTTDTTPASSSGALRFGLGEANVTLTGTAEIIAEKFYFQEGGVLEIEGGLFQVTGATDGTDTIPFDATGIIPHNGVIVFNSGEFIVNGDYELMLDQLIKQGNIYTETTNFVDAVYDAQADSTSLTLISCPTGKAYADLTNDCIVNLDDFAILADQWLN